MRFAIRPSSRLVVSRLNGPKHHPSSPAVHSQGNVNPTESKTKRMLPGLGAAKTSLEILKNFTSVLPGPVQAVVETGLLIVKYAEEAKNNKEKAVELFEVAEKMLEVIVEAVIGLPDQAKDAEFLRAVDVLLEGLRSISTEMKYLSTRNTFRRLIGKDRHAKVTKRAQQDLAQAITIFEMKERMSKRALDAQNHKAVMVELRTIASHMPAATHPATMQSCVPMMTVQVKVNAHGAWRLFF